MVVDVFIERCRSYDQADIAIEKLLSKIHFKPKNILLKPNLLLPADPKKAITTHPAIVEGVCKYLRKNYPKAKIIMGESSGCLGVSKTKEAFEVCGMNRVLKKYKIKAIAFEETPLVTVRNPKGQVWKEFKFPKVVVDADLIVNLPKLKTHSLTVFTGAVKNLYGCIPGGIKGKGHMDAPPPDKFSQLVLDNYELIKPKLNIMDGVIGMEGLGPGNGDPKKVGYILASTNAVALDAVCLKLTGIKQSKVATITNAKARGLLPDYRIVGSFKPVKFKVPSTWKFTLLRAIPKPIANFLATYAIRQFMKTPEIHYDKCTKCYTCVRVCPVKAIKIKNRFPVIDYDKCIKCLCCLEHCPDKAIGIKRNIIQKIFNR